MLFILSKLLSAVTQPLFWLIIWWAAGLGMLRYRPRVALAMLWGGLVLLLVLGVQALPDALLRKLERQYPALPDVDLTEYAGLIVLGGALGIPSLFTEHGQIPLGDSAERMTIPTGLMHRYPHLQLLFSGGEGRLRLTGVTEAEMAKVFYRQQGVDMTRVRFEGGARNTRENAVNTAALLGEECQSRRWLMVTSAWHMPRAMAEFKAVGCSVAPYPVDFLTVERTPMSEYSLAHSLVRWQVALHEWLGRLVYASTR